MLLFLISALLVSNSPARYLLDAEGQRPRFAHAAADALSDSVAVWVFFTDKQITGPAELNARWPALPWARPGQRPSALDLPVPPDYLNAVTATGARIRHASRWLGAVSAQTTAAQRTQIQSLPFVSFMEPVARGRRDTRYDTGPASSATSTADYPQSYGLSLLQLLPLQVPELHALGLSGAGVLIAILDTGFRLVHDVFDSLNTDGRVIDQWDFVQGDSLVANDSLDVPGQDFHGTEVLSTMAALKPGELVGASPRAQFLLAKTEDLASETPVEEDHYVAALEWADSAGARVLSSSLSYDFGYVMDGTEGISTLAANTAAARGLLLVTAVGNSGPQPTTLGAPADAFDIVSVGAVDASGTIAFFSSRGPTADGRTKPEVVAQGVAVNVADPSSPDGYVAVNGTSFATPLTAASAALLVGAHPDWTPLMLREALMSSGDHHEAPDNAYGSGRFALLPALDYAPAGALQLVPQLYDAYDSSAWQLKVIARANADRMPDRLVAHYQQFPGASDSLELIQQDDSVWQVSLPWNGESELRWRLVAEDPVGRIVHFPPDPHRQLWMRRMPEAWTEDFEAGSLRWERGGTHELFWPQAADAFEGQFALSDSPGGGYPNSCNAWIRTVVAARVGDQLPWLLTLRTRHQLSAGDTGHVEWRRPTDTAWQTAANITGTQSPWQPLELPLPLVAGDSVWLQFRLTTDATATGDGWYVDSVRLGPSPVSVSGGAAVRPEAWILNAFPNPFNGATRLGIRLDQPAEVQLFVYDVLGRRVRTLWNGTLGAGAQTFTWDARNDHGVALGSGVYLVSLLAQEHVVTRKLLLLK